LTNKKPLLMRGSRFITPRKSLNKEASWSFL
jgi:hypothetical protein